MGQGGVLSFRGGLSRLAMPVTMSATMAVMMPLFCGACTVVSVDGGQVKRYAGMLEVRPAAGADLVAVTTQKFGFVADGHSLVVGAQRETRVSAVDPARCFLIVFVERNGASISPELQKLIQENPNVCVSGGTEDGAK